MSYHKILVPTEHTPPHATSLVCERRRLWATGCLAVLLLGWTAFMYSLWVNRLKENGPVVTMDSTVDQIRCCLSERVPHKPLVTAGERQEEVTSAAHAQEPSSLANSVNERNVATAFTPPLASTNEAEDIQDYFYNSDLDLKVNGEIQDILKQESD